MPSLYAPADAVNRKLRELHARDAGGTNRKLREAWARDSAGTNRKIFSGADAQVSFYTENPYHPLMFSRGGITGDNDIDLAIGFNPSTSSGDYFTYFMLTLPAPIAYSPSVPLFDVTSGTFYTASSFTKKTLTIRADGGVVYSAQPPYTSNPSFKLYPDKSGSASQFMIQLDAAGTAHSYETYQMEFRTGTNWQLCGKQIKSVELI